jgi:hypothetical protein
MSKAAIKLAVSNDKTHLDDARLAKAYKDLEGELCQALQMATIVADRIGDTFERTPGSRGMPESTYYVPQHQAEAHLFAVDHLQRMMIELKAKYYAAYEEAVS